MDSSDNQRAAFAKALAAAIRGQNRSRFAVAVADESGESVSENAISLWLIGKTEPTRVKVFAMERVLELPPGSLSSHLGYLPLDAIPSLTPEEALLRDTSIPRAVRLALIAGVKTSRGG